MSKFKEHSPIEMNDYNIFDGLAYDLLKKEITRKDMTHGVISIDSILLNSMRNGKNVNFRGRKMGITSPPP